MVYAEAVPSPDPKPRVKTTGHDAGTTDYDPPESAVTLGRNARSRCRNDRSRWARIPRAIMAANLLSSPRAIEVSVYVVRALVRMRELAATHGDLAKRLAELEEKTEALAMSHDTFSRNTRNQLKQVFDALHELMTPPDPPKRPIGFVTHEDKDKKTSGQTRGKPSL